MKINLWLLFIILTFILTWSVEIPLAMATHGYSRAHIPKTLQTICTLSPGIVGILLTGIFFHKKGMKLLLKGIIKWKVSLKWYLLLLLFSIVYCGISLLLFNIIFNQSIIPDQLYNFIFYFLLILPLSALWEEIGWRGFLLPELQKKYTTFQASLIIGFFWGLWHLPVYLAINPYGDKTLEYFLFMFIGCFALSIIQTWFYISTNRSLLICILFHNAINTSAVYFYGNLKGGEFRPLMIFVLLLVITSIIILRLKKGIFKIN